MPLDESPHAVAPRAMLVGVRRSRREYPWCLGSKAVPLPEHLDEQTEPSPIRRITDICAPDKPGPHRSWAAVWQQAHQ